MTKKTTASTRTGNRKPLIPAVGYLRRSSDSQEGSIPDQRKALEHYAQQHGYNILGWYTDDAISGDDTERRKAFQRMSEDAQREDAKFKVILCWDQDRFGRFDLIEAGKWIAPLRDAGVRLETVAQGPIDWVDLTGQFLYSAIQLGKAQFLRDLSRNVLRGQIEAAKAGSWVGSVPYAYKLEGGKKAKRLILDDEGKIRVVKRIFREYVEEGRSMSEIASRLDADGIVNPGRAAWPKPRRDGSHRWRFDAVRWILENPVYIGTFRFNVTSRSKYHSYQQGSIVSGKFSGDKGEEDWIVIHDHHEPIIDKPTFEKAQAILAKGKTGRSPYTKDNNPFLLSGLLRCGRCGAPLHGLNNGKFRYYECSRRKHDQDCEGTTVREDTLMEFIADSIEQDFLSRKDCAALLRKAEAGTLQPADLPAGFQRLRKLVVAKQKPQANRQTTEKEFKRIESKLATVKRNLAYVDPEFIAGLQEEIRGLEIERQALRVELDRKPITEQDLTASVKVILAQLILFVTVVRKGGDLNKQSGSFKRLLQNISHIAVFAERRGDGTGKRFVFQRGEIHFKQVGLVTGKSNPHHPD